MTVQYRLRRALRPRMVLGGRLAAWLGATPPLPRASLGEMPACLRQGEDACLGGVGFWLFPPLAAVEAEH